MDVPSHQVQHNQEGGRLMPYFWRRLTSPRAGNEDEAQHEYMTKVILVFDTLVTLSFMLIALPGWLLKAIPADTILGLLGMSLLFIAGWLMADRGRWRLGGAIPCLVLLTAGVYGNYIGGIDAPAMLLYGLAIVLATVLLKVYAQLGILAVSLASFLLFGLAHTYGYLHTLRSANNMFINRVGIVFAALAAIWLGVWFLKDQYQRSLAQARASAENTRAIFEAVTDGILFVNLSGEIMDFNDSLARIIHLEDRNLALGRPVTDFIYPDDRVEFVEFYNQLLAGPADGLVRGRGLTTEGEAIDLELNASVFRDAQGKTAGFVSTVRDITLRIQSEQELARHREHLEELVEERTAELKEAYSELESFSYSISHDLRSPLRRIEGFSSILSEEYAGMLPGEGLGYLRRIKDSSQRMSVLIGDLLAFSRLIRQPLACRLIHPAEIARSVVDELTGGVGGDQSVKIEIQELPSCNADPVLLRQVFFNLLDNALKYSRKRAAPLVEVGSRNDGDQVIYTVRDNGIGFDMQYAARLFGVFQRLHPESEYEGTGIGLATVQRIIRRHNGKIWAESAPDQGTTFYFTLGNARDS
jgi:PAS domain S-box-containing protein